MNGSLATLRRKLLRDLRHNATQLLAIALVMACGVGVHLGMRATMASLLAARDGYYAESRFAHVFAGLTRAPERVARELEQLDGVAAVETRVLASATLELGGVIESINARLLSIPDRGGPLLNDLRLVAGRWPAEGAADEVLVNQGFALARDLAPGARLRALIEGRFVELTLVGVALSPEFTYAVGPGQVFPDDARTAVVWMRRSALARAVDSEGAFNDVSLRVMRGVEDRAVIRAVDGLLEPWGGAGAIARRDQISAFFLDNELKQVETLSRIMPVLFLGVAALLLNVVLARLVATQRGEIGALKAFGYTDREVGRHFVGLVAAVVVAGCACGYLLGTWLSSTMTTMYAEYYRLPDFVVRIGLGSLLEAFTTASVASGLGAFVAVRRAVCLPPAEALRAAPPLSYRPTVVERLGLARRLPPTVRIVLRELERRPARALMSVVGIAFAGSLGIAHLFAADAVHRLLDVQYGLTQHEDARLAFARPRPLGALSSTEALPGVLHAEPVREVPARLCSNGVERLVGVQGRTRSGRLAGAVDDRLFDVPPPSGGLSISRKLAEVLGVGVGDLLRIEVLEGRRPELTVPVGRIVESFVGASVQADLFELAGWLGEAPTADAMLIALDQRRRADFHRAVRETPEIIGVSERGPLLANVRAMLTENLGTMLAITVAFAGVLALGVLYNAARIHLAERARDLASLRVLGFRRGEVASILLGELGVLVALGTPLGLLLGSFFARSLAASPGFDTEQFRLPYVIEPATYAIASLIVLGSAWIAALVARTRLNEIDLVAVLKARD